MSDCVSCQIETAKLGMLVCGIVIALLIVFNIDEVRHWWIRQIRKVIGRIFPP